jgi:hypothetical protein
MVLLEGLGSGPLVKSARLSRAFVGLADSDTFVASTEVGSVATPTLRREVLRRAGVLTRR